MEEKNFIVPDSGHIAFREGEGPTKVMEFRVIKCSSKRNDPIEVKRTIRPGFRELMPGESWDWRNAYN